MDKHKKNYIIYLVLGIIVLFLLSLFIVFGLKAFFKSKVNENDVYINSSQYVVKIEDKLSVSDEFGKIITDDNNKSFGYVEFEVYNNIESNSNYQIYITGQEKESDMSPGYLKFYLTDDKDNALENYGGSKLPSYIDLNYLDDKPSSKLLYSGSLEGLESKKFKLRVWLTDSYVVSNSEKSFSFEIGVRAV